MVLLNPHSHPDIITDDKWYLRYSQKKEFLQELIDKWSEKQEEFEKF